MKSPSPKWRVYLASAVVGATALGLLLTTLRRSHHTGPNEVADKLILAIRNKDANALYKMMSPYERAKLGITIDKTQWLVDQYVAPNLKKFRPLDTTESIDLSSQASAGRVLRLRSSSGHEMVFDVVAVDTPDGASSAIVSTLVLNGIYGRYMSETPGLGMGVRRRDAWIRGLQAEIPKLEKAGIMGFVNDGYQGEIVSWRTHLARISRRSAGSGG